MFKNLKLLHVCGAVVIGIGVGAIAYDLLFLGGTGGHPEALCYDDNASIVEVCDSVPEDKALEIFEEFIVLTNDGYDVPTVIHSSCLGPPERGYCQIRAETDLVEPFIKHMPDGYADLVGFKDGACVAYWNGKDAWRLHMLLHTMGYGHTTAATSVMYGPPDHYERDGWYPDGTVDYTPGTSLALVKADCKRRPRP